MSDFMKRWMRFLGSLRIAVPVLIAIAVVLAWGTFYETAYGTAAVQRFIYHSWWFQLLLAFLAANLATAALQRYPWKKQHVPFVLAHIGIILILLGGVIGARWGIEGHVFIPENQASRLLEMPGKVLAVHDAASGGHAVIPTRFETQAWVHEPDFRRQIRLGGRHLSLSVDKYYPDAATNETVLEDGDADNPAIQLRLRHEAHEESLWLFARNPERFGASWGGAHVLFLEPENEQQRSQLLGRGSSELPPRGVVLIRLGDEQKAHAVAVPVQMNVPVRIAGTDYVVTFKDYFADFALAENGPVSRSEQPNNPAVALTLSGPEGSDAHLLFALHPDFAAMHGRQQKIKAEVRYRHAVSDSVPPNAIVLIPASSSGLAAVLTDAEGNRQVIDPVKTQTPYTHTASGHVFSVTAHYPRARIEQEVINRGNEVKAEFLHVSLREGGESAQAWVGLRGSADFRLGGKPLTVEFRQAQQELPVTIKLLDFRKIEYPGIQMAAGFESDVELTDMRRGMILMRKISMNNPLRYRNFSFYQSSFIPGQVETTVLAVRSDPGTPIVYAGFIIVILGVVSLFVARRKGGRRRG